jgi:hypothetical protein
MDDPKVHQGSPRPNLLRPVGGPSLKLLYGLQPSSTPSDTPCCTPMNSSEFSTVFLGGTYEFRVSAENKAGIGGPASPPGPVRLKDQLKGKPPRITEPTLNTTAVLGTQV